MEYFKKIKYNSDTALAISRLVLFVTAVILLSLCAAKYYANKNSDSITDQSTTTLYKDIDDADAPITLTDNYVETTQQNGFNFTVGPYSGPVSEKCQLEAIADGKCQDELNVPECGFDGGDCCMTNIVTDYCEKCHCHMVTGVPNLSYCMTHGLAQNNEIITLDNYNDGECHDEFNNYLCNFDGGDCCSPYSSNYWCNECLCIWENPTYPVLTTRDARCDLAGDGFCDDSTNDGSCQFDGGDCCLPEVKKDFCVFCHCYASQQYQEQCWGTIWDSSIIGDGVCSDDLNTPFCDYDGGDCCLPYIVKSCLYNCICHEDGLVHPTFEVCDFPYLIGDGICDGYYNTPICYFDGGDCCGPEADEFLTCADNCQCFTAENYTDTNSVEIWHGFTEPPYCYDPSGIGDGICDDYSNNKACNYDQGDCCIGIKGVLCNICECKQNSTDYPVITTEWDPYLNYCAIEDVSIIGDGSCDAEAAIAFCNFDGGDCSNCPAIGYIGDMTCDDENNVEECDWDGNDCCVDKEHLFCIECKCHL